LGEFLSFNHRCALRFLTFFSHSCDVGKFSERNVGLLDTNVYDFEQAFGTKLGMNKAERLKTGESAMTHAMVITAAHVVDGKPVRYRVENSWGPDAGDKGFFVATADWVAEYVYQIVASRHLLPKDLVEVYDSPNVTELPPWVRPYDYLFFSSSSSPH
jgi:bleomycin hydrolase